MNLQICITSPSSTCHGYWSIVLDEESSLLTTFNSPFGRYCFLHLPFGLVCSQDIFQKKMDQSLKECPGCIGITDDITIHGCTEAKHDAHLQNLMQVACKYGVVFNPQKMYVKAPAIKFFGCLYDANGVHLDLEKVDAVHALPTPTNVTEHCQWHHPQILWPVTACDHTSQCFPGRSRHSTPTEQQTCSFHKQSTHLCRTQICKHRERC